MAGENGNIQEIHTKLAESYKAEAAANGNPAPAATASASDTNPASTPPEPAATTTATTTASTPDTPNPFMETITKEFGDQFKTVEDFMAYAKEKPKEVTVEKVVEKEVEKYPDDITKAISDYVKGGGKHIDFYKTQFTDWKTVSDETVAKELLKEKYPKATNDQIAIFYKKEYDFKSGIEEDDLTTEDKETIELSKMKLVSDADLGRQKFIEKQVKSSTPPNTQTELERQNSIKAAQEEQNKFQAQWEKDITNVMTTQKDFTLKVPTKEDGSETMEVKYEYKKEDLDLAKSILLNPTLENFYKPFYNADKTFDNSKFHKAVMLMTNPDAIINEMSKTIYKGIDAAYKKRLSNPSFSNSREHVKADDSSDDAFWKKHVAGINAAKNQN